MQFRKWLYGFGLFAAVAAVSGGGATAQSPAPLFEDAGPSLVVPATAARSGSGPRVVRTRRARLAAARLGPAVSAGLAGDTSPLLQLNLFDDVSFAAVFERHHADIQGFQSWVGRVAGDPMSTATITWRGDDYVGSVQTGNELYRFGGSASGGHVEQIDPNSFGTELAPVVPPASDAPLLAPASQVVAPAAGEVVDVFVFYTSAAAAAAPGTGSNIAALIAQGVADANTAYARSGLSTSLRLVGSGELPGFVEGASMSVDLPAFRGNATVGSTRDTYGADLMALITSTAACGVGYIGPSINFAHSITGYDCITGHYTFAHELGHNLGSEHAPGDTAGQSPWKPYAYGYRSGTSFRTVMAYPPAIRILNFSNPSVLYTGLPTGTGTQNNALALSEAFPIVQAFRTPSSGPSPPSAPQNLSVTASGNTVTASWSAPASGTPSNYAAQVGTAPGGANVFNGSVGLATSASGVLPNGTYYVRLYAQNIGGTSPSSVEATVVVGTPVTLPGAPQNLTGGAAGTLVSVSWSAPASGGAPTGYFAQVGSGPGGSNIFSGAVGAATNASGNLGPGTYYIRLYAVNSAGMGPASNELTVTVGPTCTVPAAPVLSGSKSGNVISINWTTPAGGPVTGYTVQAGSTSGSSGFFNGPVGLTNAVSAAVGNGPYFIRVLANSACGSSGVSNEVSLTIP